jgi:hypothetical protein
LYSSTDIIRQIKSRRMRWAGHVAGLGERRKLYRVLLGETEVKGTLERPRRSWEDGIKMDLRGTGWGGVEWIHLAQDMCRWRAVVNSMMKLGFWLHRVCYPLRSRTAAGGLKILTKTK